MKDAARKSGRSLDEILFTVKQAGIDYLDFHIGDLTDGLPAAVKNAGLGANTVYASFDFCDEGSLSAAKRAADTAAQFGAGIMYVQKPLENGALSDLKALNEKDEIFAYLNKSTAALKTAAALEILSLYAEEKGITASVEDFDSHGSLTERKAELEWLFGKAPHLKFNLDTGNSVTCGENITDLFADFKEKTVNIHCKDRAYSDGKLCTCPVGKGFMPIKEIKEKITADGYTGGFSIEVFGVEDPLEAIIDSAGYLLNN